MSTQTTDRPESTMAPWHSLGTGGPLLAEAIAHRFEAMVSMPLDEFRASTAELLDFESSLPGERLRAFMVSKLRAFTMVEPSTAQTMMEEINVFLSTRPAEMLMRRQVALQGASRELTLDEISHLEPLLPNIRELAGLPPRKYAADVSVVGPEPRPPAKRSFWKAFLRA